MCPHSDYFDRLDVVENLVNKAMLNVYSARENTGKVSYKFLVWWWVLIRVFSKDIQ